MPLEGFGQVSAELRWAHDTLSIGQPTALHLTLRYPTTATLEMPEESQWLSGFEVLDNQLESRKTAAGGVVEKRTYRVASFRVDSLQQVQLRFRAIVDGDSGIVESNTAGILLNSRLPKGERLDELTFKPQMDLPALKPPFPWAIFVLVFSIAGVVLGAMAWWFWPVYWRRKQLQTAKAEYQAQLAGIDTLETANTTDFINQLNATWKPYLSQGHEVDFSSLTAKEFEARRLSMGLSEADAHAVIELQRAEEALNYAGSGQLDVALCTKRARALLQTAHNRRVHSIIEHTPKRL